MNEILVILVTICPIFLFIFSRPIIGCLLFYSIFFSLSVCVNWILITEKKTLFCFIDDWIGWWILLFNLVWWVDEWASYSWSVVWCNVSTIYKVTFLFFFCFVSLVWSHNHQLFIGCDLIHSDVIHLVWSEKKNEMKQFSHSILGATKMANS